MDDASFDRLIHPLTTIRSRRRILGALLGGVPLALFDLTETEGKKKKKKKKKRSAAVSPPPPAPTCTAANCSSGTCSNDICTLQRVFAFTDDGAVQSFIVPALNGTVTVEALGAEGGSGGHGGSSGGAGGPGGLGGKVVSSFAVTAGDQLAIVVGRAAGFGVPKWVDEERWTG